MSGPGSSVVTLRERLFRRGDSEHVQALIRIAFGLFFTAYLYVLVGARAAIHFGFMLFVVVSFGMLFAIALWPQPSNVRRALGAFIDIGTTTLVMCLTGELGAPFYGVYVWVTFGNGFRYGVRWLYASQLMSIAGFGLVVAVNPFWREHALLAGGLLLLLCAVPAYGAIMLRQLEVANRGLHEQAMRDALTGLYNRRYLIDAFERELHRARRSRDQLAVLVLDIDHFKRINDTFGHAAGDEVLRCVARFMLSVVRAGDILCRLGGEEFVLLQGKASAEAIQQRADSLRRDIAKLDIVHHGRRVGPVTLSIGIAMYPAHGETVDAMLHAADDALYCAKNAGRDRVAMAPCVRDVETRAPITFLR